MSCEWNLILLELVKGPSVGLAIGGALVALAMWLTLDKIPTHLKDLTTSIDNACNEILRLTGRVDGLANRLDGLTAEVRQVKEDLHKGVITP